MQRIRSWWRDLTRRRVLDDELDAELRYHLERDIEEHIAAGCSPEEARRRAHAAFGAVGAIKEEVRETRATHLIESTWLDVRYGARSLRRNPLFTLTAITTLALTMAAVTTLLTVANAFFLRPLPVHDPDRLVEVVATRDNGTREGYVSFPDYERFRDGTRTLDGLAAAYVAAPLFVSGADEAMELPGAVVTANFFPLLGLEPAAGRFFSPEEDRVPGGDPVIVLGYDQWRSRYGADPAVLGKTLQLNGVTFTIIGVAPERFHGIGTAAPQIYMPAMMLPVGYRWCSVLEDEECTILRMFGRLADGAGASEAEAEMKALMPERWRTAEPGDNSGVAVLSMRGTDSGETDRRFLALLSAVDVALLLVCCANLAGLLTARAGARARELAVRTSLGAPRLRLLRQMLTESTLLAVAGGGIGVLLSLSLTRAVAAMFYTTDGVGRPYYVDLSLDPRVIAAVLALAAVCGLLFGFLPALAAVRLGGGAAGTLRSSSSSLGGGARPGRWLLGAQTAGAVAFVVIAALLSSSAGALLHGANYDPNNVALLRLRPRLVSYGPARAQAFVRGVLERISELPEVESVTMVGTGGALWGSEADVSLPGAEAPLLSAGYIEVGPRYFETLRTPVLRGRELDERDDASSPAVAIVNEAFAAAVWPGDDPLRRDLVIAGRRFTVVGVVADVPLQRRDDPTRPYVYTAFWQNPESVDARLQVRVRGDAAAMLPRLMGAASRVDPEVPVTEGSTLPQVIAGSLRSLRMGAVAVSYAGALAVLLSALGLYAALAAGVTARGHEIGVRRALGAKSGDVFRMIVGQGLAVILAGVIGGLAVAAASARLLAHLLYGAATGDAALYALAGAVVCASGILACLAPAARAARTAPLRAMRPR